jgi:hypothetical protein
MRSCRYVWYLILLVIVFSSCEDVITLDLNNGVTKLIVNGYISTAPGPYIIKLSQSNNYFEPNVFVPEKGANVVISDNTGVSETLKEITPGNYSTTNLMGIGNRTYTLSITTTGNKSYVASSFMPMPVSIDSLHDQIRLRNGSNSPGKGPVSYRVSCYFTDPAGLGNYYRLRYFKNDTLQNGDRDYVIASDQLANGQSNTPRLTDGVSNSLNVRGRYLLKDSVKVELLAIDKKGFDFFSDLQKLLSDQGSIVASDAPSNPINNISNGALGYFGAYGISTKKIVIH